MKLDCARNHVWFVNVAHSQRLRVSEHLSQNLYLFDLFRQTAKESGEMIQGDKAAIAIFLQPAQNVEDGKKVGVTARDELC